MTCRSGNLLFRSSTSIFLLEEEFICNPEFLTFFIAATEKRVADGSSAKTMLPVAGPGPCQAIRSVTTAAGESDVLVVYESKEGPPRKIAILIEDKIKAGFQKNQAQRYKDRGAAGLKREWDDFWTCLVFPGRYALDCAGFDRRISLEAIHGIFAIRDDPRSRFKAGVIRAALDHFESSGLRVEDHAMTAFRRFYAERAELYFANRDSEIEWPLPRPAWWGDSWFQFRSTVLPRRAGHSSGIIHKCAPGLVHLYFEKMSADLLRKALLGCVCSDHLKAVQTGKSASLELRVPPIRNFTDSIQNRDALSQAFTAVETLVNFCKVNERILQEQIVEAWERSGNGSGLPK